MSSACQKDFIDKSDSFSRTTPDGITNFTDLSGSETTKSEHPFFQALDPQRYYFAVDGSKSCCGDDSHPDRAGITPNFTRSSSGNAGEILIGRHLFKPGTNNNYGEFGNADDPVTDPALMENFGKLTSFNFKGSGDIQPFSGDLYFPKLLTFSNINDIQSSKVISRGEGFSVSYPKDSETKLPLMVEVYWSKNEHMDPTTAKHKYNVVTNLFLVDDNGSLTLTNEMFKDMPKKAKLITVTLWRGNAVKDSQGIYFMAATSKGFSVQLTD